MFIIQKSTNPKKKLMVTTDSGKVIHFGAKNYRDFIQYNKINKSLALKKRAAYLARHSVNEDFNDTETAGFWSRWILWNKPTLRGSINNTSKKFKIKIIYKYK